MWGFTNGTKRTLAQLAFPNMRLMKWAARDYRRAGKETYESSVDPLLRFFHNRDILPASWIAIKSHSPVDEDDAMSRAPLEISTTFDQVSPSDRTTRPPLVLASFDLECHAAQRDDGSRKFPCSEREDDVIIQVATSFQRYGEPEPYRQLIMALRDTDPVQGVDVRCFDDEAEMINAWCDELLAEGADLLLSYNGDQVGQSARNPSSSCLMHSSMYAFRASSSQSSSSQPSAGSTGGSSSGMVVGSDAAPSQIIGRSSTGATCTAAPWCWWTTTPASPPSTCPSWGASTSAAASWWSAS